MRAHGARELFRCEISRLNDDLSVDGNAHQLSPSWHDKLREERSVRMLCFLQRFISFVICVREKMYLFIGMGSDYWFIMFIYRLIMAADDYDQSTFYNFNFYIYMYRTYPSAFLSIQVEYRKKKYSSFSFDFMIFVLSFLSM